MSASGRRPAVGSGGSARWGRKNQPRARAQSTRTIQVASVATLLDVQVPHELCVLLDEPPPRLDLIAHERLEQGGRLERVLHRDLEEGAPGGIHRGVAQ